MGCESPGGPDHRVEPQRQRVQGIVGQPGRVMAVLLPTRQADAALLQQIAWRVPDRVGIPAIWQTRRQSIRQLEAIIQRLKSHDAAIDAGMSLIESGHRLHLGIAFEGQLRETRCCHQGSFPLYGEASQHRSSSTGWSLDGFFSCQSHELFRLAKSGQLTSVIYLEKVHQPLLGN